MIVIFACFLVEENFVDPLFSPGASWRCYPYCPLYTLDASVTPPITKYRNWVCSEENYYTRYMYRKLLGVLTHMNENQLYHWLFFDNVFISWFLYRASTITPFYNGSRHSAFSRRYNCNLWCSGRCHICIHLSPAPTATWAVGGLWNIQTWSSCGNER